MHLNEETKNEIVAFLFFAIAMLLLMSLVTELFGSTWMGIIGTSIARFMFFIFGRYVSFILVGVLLLWGVGLFQRRASPGKSNFIIRFIGAFLLIVSLCSFLALLPNINKDFQFQLGGLIGTFVSNQIVITQYVGPMGAYVITLTGVLIGFIIATEFIISAYFLQLKEKWKNSRKEKSKPKEPKITPKIEIAKPTEPVIRPEPEKEKIEPKISFEEIDKKPKPERKITKPVHPSAPTGEYQLPPIDLLREPSPSLTEEQRKEELLKSAEKLQNTLASFGIEARVSEISPGPVVTRFEVEPAPGVRINSIAALANDLALAMAAESVRIAAVPNKSSIGIEVPNLITSDVLLREVLSSDDFKKSKSKLTLGLGKTIAGDSFIADLARMPHLLVAGTTGSGKSVCVNSMIASILFQAKPDEVKFILIDPKRVELSVYNEIPHLLTPIVTESKKAGRALKWAVTEMERRYSLLADVGVKDIESFNQLVERQKDPTKAKALNIPDITLEKMPIIIIVIDELAELMMVSKSENEDIITRIAQLARAVGIHLILATQRPSVDVITGLIKNNIPSRIAFQVPSRIDSRTILDGSGAESLLGRGDMLFNSGGSKLTRLQGCFISNDEVQALTDFVRSQKEPDYVITSFDNVEVEDDEVSIDSKDEKYEEAVRIVRATRQASASMLQTKMGIGYPRARKIIEIMEREGLIGGMRGSKPREIYMPEDADL